MNFSDLEKEALKLNELYEQLEVKRWGRAWSTQELALGFMGDVGDLAKLIQAHAGVRTIDDHQAKLGHELSDCLWSIMVLAKKCGDSLLSLPHRGGARVASSASLGRLQAQSAASSAQRFGVRASGRRGRRRAAPGQASLPARQSRGGRLRAGRGVLCYIPA